jgi:hypothetical protein
MRAAAFALAIAFGVMGCLGPAGRQFRTSLPEPGVVAPFPIVLGDDTGLVVGVEPGPIDTSAGIKLAVQEDPTNPNAIIAIWLGGAIDDDAVLSFRRVSSGYALSLEVHRGFGASTGEGIYRSVRIVTTEAISVASITVSGGN